ncbi:HAD family hydrolase [Shimia haliotis]|uniref:Haloacid dehalogenase superfamily, subfamily IA, variant 3 with third motif having DD or ED n=1 Tax=Shimia haliotis TaxID=1280847 RepID=A0A1I4B4L4_9RHOB|nr:HAD family phosphatase [Shimia haliotis]SFK63300.1 haloacid dehalogenase superfamily, subfamily IA, variant 3 with third motif having DD or ED [Shimia haliotis]
MTLGAIRGALFDMDGLLLDSERQFMAALVEVAADVGVTQTAAEAFFATLVGTSNTETTARLQAFLPPRVDVRTFDQDWRALYRSQVARGVPVKAHVIDLLQGLRSHGVPMCVVTSTVSEMAQHKLETAGLRSFFEGVVAGDMVSANKPDPAPYLAGAELLGLQAEECVAFEDSDVGTRAATQAGCLTYQVPDLRPEGVALPNLGQHAVGDLWQAGVHLGVLKATLT